jgi:hypothetical protein
VLSGVLTVYDGGCRRQSFEPGHPYVGGQQIHLVGNETDAPVTMIVTYLNPMHDFTLELAPRATAARAAAAARRPRRQPGRDRPPPGRGGRLRAIPDFFAPENVERLLAA